MTGSRLSRAGILKVAVDAPLPRLFDYVAPAGSPPAAGCRVVVPFGRRRVTGLILAHAETSEVSRDKLRRVHAVVDDTPLLAADDLWLIRFVADYYHHPVGEVVAAALPALLRRGRPLTATLPTVSLTTRGARVEPESIAARAPRQAQVVAFLAERSAETVPRLDRELPEWRHCRRALLDKGWIEIGEVPVAAAKFAAIGSAAAGPTLNADQRRAVEAVRRGEGFTTTLLDGVTGSGKTEVYLRLAAETLATGRQALFLVPEIGLTPQLIGRIEGRLGVRPAVLHSGLTEAERLEAWRAAHDGSAAIVLGTRSAIFTPLRRPGLIVVDEEHDASFKQQDGLRYSARDLAVARGKRSGVPVVLGSATPSLDTLRRASDGAYRHVTLGSRAGGARPPRLRLVDVRRHRAEDGVSDPLATAIRRHLDDDGQVLVFLNRRGFAPTLICQACGHVAECDRCDARMTVHRRDGRLTCHHCGSARALDPVCAACGGATVPLGEGTERIEDALLSRFPDVPIARVDSDSIRAKGSMQRTLATAVSGEARILVGTQMLSKGHHFPRLTLVGVVNADQGLFSTDFRGSERLAQSLIQVAGRAGRELRDGEVLIQTAFPEHSFWGELLGGGYHRVAAFALSEREAAGWPPYSRIALLRAAAHRREHTMEFLAAAAGLAAGAASAEVRILGPVSAPMERLGGLYRGQLLLQCRRRQPLHAVLALLEQALHDLPSMRRVRWSIDVDPIELF